MRAKSYLDVFRLTQNRIFRRIQRLVKGTFYKLKEKALKINYRTLGLRKNRRKLIDRGETRIVVLSFFYYQLGYYLCNSIFTPLLIFPQTLLLLLFKQKGSLLLLRCFANNN